MGWFADQNRAGGGGFLQPRGQIHGTAEDGIFEPLIGTEIAHRAKAGADAHADSDR